MANYCCVCRTNYFKVKDVQVFEEWASKYEVRVIQNQVAENDVLVGLVSEEPDCGVWPSYDGETDQEIDFISELSKHLADDEVAILMEAGAEKARYVCGVALAVNADGDILSIDLDEIYGMVKKEWNVVPTRAEY
jgi:hypothetical protein